MRFCLPVGPGVCGDAGLRFEGVVGNACVCVHIMGTAKHIIIGKKKPDEYVQEKRGQVAQA